MRSDTEHLHDWQRALQNHEATERENVAVQRTRQMQRLATTAYAKIFRDLTVHRHFASEGEQIGFLQLSDTERRVIWGNQLDLAIEPLVERYDQWNRAM